MRNDFHLQPVWRSCMWPVLTSSSASCYIIPVMTWRTEETLHSLSSCAERLQVFCYLRGTATLRPLYSICNTRITTVFTLSLAPRSPLLLIRHLSKSTLIHTSSLYSKCKAEFCISTSMLPTIDFTAKERQAMYKTVHTKKSAKWAGLMRTIEMADNCEVRWGLEQSWWKSVAGRRRNNMSEVPGWTETCN